MRSFLKKPFLVLDVDQDLIKALILEQKGKDLVVLRNHINKEGILSSLQEIQEGFRKDIKKIPLLVCPPSNLLRARAIDFSFNRKIDCPIDKKEEMDLMGKVLDSVKKRVSQEFLRDCGILPEDLHFTNFKVTERKINGYLVDRLAGYSGLELDLKVLVSFIPKRDFKKINFTFDQAGVKIDKIAHLSEALSEVSYLRDFKHIKPISNDRRYLSSLLMSYYAKEVL